MVGAFGMWLRRWAQGRIGSRGKRQGVPSAARRARPGLEVLEERRLLAAYLVTSATDDGKGDVAGTLSYGITQANAGHFNAINFGIGTPGTAQTITPTSALPTLTASNVSINGLSQNTSGHSLHLITINGASAGLKSSGLVLKGSNDLVSGLILEGFNNGIEVQGTGNSIGGTSTGAGNVLSGNRNDGVFLSSSATAALLQGNFIGTIADGTGGLANQNGIADLATNVSIGGDTAGAGNVISGNTNDGVYLASSASGAVLEGNSIGTNAAGTGAIANHWGIVASASTVSIGGTTSGAGNLISGNTGAGIFIPQAVTGVQVLGNSIGTNAGGTGAIGNQWGIYDRGTDTSIGGTSTGAGNVLSGNTAYGVLLYGSSNQVQGNSIGTNAAGTGALGNGLDGVLVAASSNSIGGSSSGAGNLISGNALDGVFLAPSISGVQVQGNSIGTNAAGTGAIGNHWGIVASASNAIIGGTTSGAGNLISGNTGAGIFIPQAVTGVQVLGNSIGTNAAGTGAVGNEWGVYDRGTGTSIGGTSTGAGNVLSGNTAYGVLLYGSSNQVQGNFIGTNAGGTSKLANSLDGVFVGASSNSIGGTASGAGNVISGNTLDGVFVASTVTGTVLQGNSIGTNAAGTAAIANHDGIVIAGSNNSIGGTSSGNLISGNSAAGVYINTGTGNTIRHNSITANGPAQHGPGIVLTGGANGGLTAPLLSTAKLSGTSLTVAGTFTSTTTGLPFVLEFFANPTGDPEGKVFLGTATATPTSTGPQAFTFSTTTSVTGANPIITATVTDSAGNTSAFSAGVTVS